MESKWNDLLEEIPNGPQAISLDFSFKENTDFYGIPERINTFALKDTVNSDVNEPYRLYTSDHFEEIYNYHSIYGVIPIIIAREKGSPFSTGVLWSNSSDTFVDIFSQNKHRTVHWMSESGQLEFFIYGCANPKVLAYK